jgi:hypothetical protein
MKSVHWTPSYMKLINLAQSCVSVLIHPWGSCHPLCIFFYLSLFMQWNRTFSLSNFAFFHSTYRTHSRIWMTVYIIVSFIFIFFLFFFACWSVFNCIIYILYFIFYWMNTIDCGIGHTVQCGTPTNILVTWERRSNILWCLVVAVASICARIHLFLCLNCLS